MLKAFTITLMSNYTYISISKPYPGLQKSIVFNTQSQESRFCQLSENKQTALK